MSGINLLKKKEVESVEQIKLRKYLYIFGVGFLLVSLLLSVVVLITSIKLRDQAKETVSVEKEWNDKIKGLNEVEIYNSVLKQKLDNIKKIKKEVDYQAYLSLIQSVTPDGVSIMDLKMDNNGIIEFNGEAKSSVALINFFDGLVSSAEGKIQSIQLKNLMSSKDGSYRFTLSIKVIKGK